MDSSDVLKYYSRPEVKQAILEYAKDREVGVRFSLGGFGKRPDILQFSGDISEFANKGVTSFHISEERWNDPLQLNTGLTKNQLDELRKGWDLILDIDTPFWAYAKYTAFLLIEALKFHDIKHIGIKFSGGKGFHICVPFEAFPESVNNSPTKNLFPDGLRIIAEYLQEMIRDKLSEYVLSFDDIDSLITKSELKLEELMKDGKFNPFAIIDIDTVLISSRHLFRSPYSLHEKSGLVSIPINKDEVMNFEKNQAKPENIKFDCKFIDIEKIEPNEAKDLIIQAFDWYSKKSIKENKDQEKSEKEFKLPEQAVIEDYFPPCIHNILKGNMEDGKKRSAFILIKFLRHMGWSWENIQTRILIWNKKNPNPLRDNYIIAQIQWQKKQKDTVMAPNCKNQAYYLDLRICKPENLCSRITNPINFSMIKLKAFIENQPKRKKKS
jgi:hypothetical protein